MNKVKIGVIGCGWFGNFHIDNLLKMEDVQITALVSTNAEKLSSTAKKIPGVQTFNRHEDLFSGCEELDAVFICLPPDGHGNAELLAAERGIHLYIEKPVEISLDRARANAKAFEKAGILTSCGYHERYNSVLEGAKDFLKDREVGLVTGQWLGGMPGAAWWRTKERSGGQIVEQSTHIFDLLRYFFGDAESVYCKPLNGFKKIADNYDVEEASTAVISFKSGLTASVQTGCYLDESQTPGKVGVQIYCRDSRIEYDWMNEIRYITKSKTAIHMAKEQSHFKAARAFIDAVKYKEPARIRSPYADGVKTLELTLAANESMKTGAPVAL